MQTWIVFCTVGLALPTLLLIFAWRRNRPAAGVLVIPVIALVVLALAMNHDLRWVLVGADYSRRLYVTIETFTALTLINAIYAAIRKVWLAAAASAVIAFAWFFVGVVNSVA